MRADVLVVAAWAAIVIGAAWRDGTYAPASALLVTAGTFLLGAAALRRLDVMGGPARPALLIVAAVLVVTIERVSGIYTSGKAATVSAALASVAAVLVAASVVLRPAKVKAAGYACIAVATAAGVALIVSSPKPPIDVWTMLQAAGHGLSHGRNIYTLHWTTGIRYEQSNGFAYLPGSAVLLWPFHALFGDVRYGLLAAMTATAVLLVRVGKPAVGSLIGCLAIVYPKATFGLEQSWVDPLLLATLCATAYGVVRGRRTWPVVTFACCLACKQQAWILLPVAACWKEFGWRRSLLAAGGALAFMLPWATSAPRAFYHGVIAYNLGVPARLDSLSLYRVATTHGFEPGFTATAAVTVIALVATCRRMPQSASGFLLGSAFVMATFNLVNKQSFFNEWALAGGLAVAAIVFAGMASPGRLRLVSDVTGASDPSGKTRWRRGAARDAARAAS